MENSFIKKRLRDNILHGLNQSSYILLASYAFDGLINMNPVSRTTFFNLALMKFFNDVVFRNLMNTKSSMRRSEMSSTPGIYDLVVPDVSLSPDYKGDPPLHDYLMPGGTITLLTFYFTYLIMGMIIREEVNIVRILLYITSLIIIILYKKLSIRNYPLSVIGISIIIGLLFGVIMVYIVASIDINLLQSGINEKTCPSIPVVSCSYKQN